MKINACWKQYYSYDTETGIRVKAFKTLNFGNYEVKKESDTFYGVYECHNSRTVITSASTFKKACAKAKLLQIGYNQGKDYHSPSCI